MKKKGKENINISAVSSTDLLNLSRNLEALILFIQKGLEMLVIDDANVIKRDEIKFHENFRRSLTLVK